LRIKDLFKREWFDVKGNVKFAIYSAFVIGGGVPLW